MVDALAHTVPLACRQHFQNLVVREIVGWMVIAQWIEAGLVGGDRLPDLALLLAIAAVAAGLEAEPTVIADGRGIAHAIFLTIDFRAPLRGAYRIVSRAEGCQ